jgi:hypothetical protein
MHAKTSKEMFYIVNLILIFKNILFETSRESKNNCILQSYLLIVYNTQRDIYRHILNFKCYCYLKKYSKRHLGKEK